MTRRFNLRNPIAGSRPSLPESDAAPRLTAVVLTYDGRGLLETALPSFIAQTLRDYRLLIVDNGSSDDTRAWLAEHYPGADVLAIPENIGVTAALNRGWQAADTEFVALFNNDIELEPDCLEQLVLALDEHPAAGSAAAKLIDFHDRGVLDGAGDVLLWAGGGHRRGHGEADAGQYDTPEPIFGACGGAAAYRRAALEAVGPFDEAFFAFYEDVDWSWRAQLAGYGCRYVPGAVVYHMGSATLGRGLTEFTRYQLLRNGIWLIVKNYPAAALARHAPQLLLGQAGNLRRACLDGAFTIWRRAVVDALRELPRVLRQRREVQSTRRAGLHELEAVARMR